MDLMVFTLGVFAGIILIWIAILAAVNACVIADLRSWRLWLSAAAAVILFAGGVVIFALILTPVMTTLVPR